MNNLPKGWYASKTIWAALLASVWPLLQIASKQFDFALPDADTTSGFLANLGSVALALVAVWGRVTAKAPIAKASTPKASGAAVVLLGLILMSSLAACSPKQLAVAKAAAPTLVATAMASDPALNKSIPTACAATVAATDLAVAVKPSDTNVRTANTLAHASCDTTVAQMQLAVNDTKPVQPDGGSIPWLNALAVAARIAVTVAPLL